MHVHFRLWLRKYKARYTSREYGGEGKDPVWIQITFTIFPHHLSTIPWYHLTKVTNSQELQVWGTTRSSGCAFNNIHIVQENPCTEHVQPLLSGILKAVQYNNDFHWPCLLGITNHLGMMDSSGEVVARFFKYSIVLLKELKWLCTWVSMGSLEPISEGWPHCHYPFQCMNSVERCLRMKQGNLGSSPWEKAWKALWELSGSLEEVSKALWN